jgi:alpha-amylase
MTFMMWETAWNLPLVRRDPLMIAVFGSDGSSLYLDAVDLLWNAAPIKARPGDYRNGQKGAIVEFFGWPHADVGEECAFLAQAGYLGAKLFPIHEQVMSTEPFQNVMNRTCSRSLCGQVY